jgi:IS5 family transposase
MRQAKIDQAGSRASGSRYLERRRFPFHYSRLSARGLEEPDYVQTFRMVTGILWDENDKPMSFRLIYGHFYWGKSPAKRAQKDIDARWTKKGGQNHYGYKNPINIDRATKLIAAHATTSAHIHDSPVLDHVLRPEDDGGKEV